jgi:hypothetical protein
MATSPTPKSPPPGPSSTETLATAPGWASPPQDPPTARTIPGPTPPTGPATDRRPPSPTTETTTSPPGSLGGDAGDEPPGLSGRPPTSSPASTDHPADPHVIEASVGALVGSLTFGVNALTRSPGTRWMATPDEQAMAGALVASIAERHMDLSSAESSDMVDGLGLVLVGAGYVTRNLMEARAERAPNGIAPDEGSAP